MTRRGIIVAAGIAVLACRNGDAARVAAHSAPAGPLVGVWSGDAHVTVPTPLSDRHAPDVPFILALIEDSHTARVAEQADAMYDGTYDADFTPFGFDLRTSGAVPVARAQLDGDSVTIVLDPSESRRVTLRAARTGDTLQGVWRFDSRLAGAAGTFVLRRR